MATKPPTRVGILELFHGQNVQLTGDRLPRYDRGMIYGVGFTLSALLTSHHQYVICARKTSRENHGLYGSDTIPLMEKTT